MSFFREAKNILEDEGEICYEFLENVDVEGESINLYNYLHGLCNTFALHLMKKHNYKSIIWTTLNEDGKEMLMHMFNVFAIDEKPYYVDIRGITSSIKDIMVDFEDWDIEAEYTVNTVGEAEKLLLDKFNIKSTIDEEIEQELQFIDDNFANYYIR